MKKQGLKFHIMYLMYKILIGIAFSVIRTLGLLGIKIIPNFEERICCENNDETKTKNVDFWFHAASMGELRGIFPLIKHFVEEFTYKKILITTTSATGLAEIKKLLPDVESRFCPIDTPTQVRNFLSNYKVSFFCIAETEIWPCLICETKKQGAKLCLVNGRISDKTFTKYYALRFFVKEILKCFSVMFVQSRKDFQRFELLGAEKDKLIQAHSTKFDFPVQAKGKFSEWWDELDKKMGDERRYVVSFGSVRDTDEKEVVSALSVLKKSELAGRILFVIVPRHPARFEPFYEILVENKFSVARISESPNTLEQVEVLFVDRMGDLLGVYSVSDLCFVGGTFCDIGGHNVLEPAYFSKPILSGKSVNNIEEIANLLSEQGALLYVEDGKALAKQISSIINDPKLNQSMVEASQRTYRVLRGSSSEIFRILKEGLVVIFLIFQACSPIKGYQGPERPETEISILYYDSCSSYIDRKRSSVNGLEFGSSGISLLPGSYEVNAYIEFPQPPYNCISQYYFDQFGYDQCMDRRKRAIENNKKNIPYCNISDYQRRYQDCKQNFKQFACTISAQLEKGMKYDFCIYPVSGFVRAKVSLDVSNQIQNEVECTFLTEEVRDVRID